MGRLLNDNLIPVRQPIHENGDDNNNNNNNITINTNCKQYNCIWASLSLPSEMISAMPRVVTYVS